MRFFSHNKPNGTSFFVLAKNIDEAAVSIAKATATDVPPSEVILSTPIRFVLRLFRGGTFMATPVVVAGLEVRVVFSFSSPSNMHSRELIFVPRDND